MSLVSQEREQQRFWEQQRLVSEGRTVTIVYYEKGKRYSHSFKWFGCKESAREQALSEIDKSSVQDARICVE
jgi:hypothetical protein